MVHVRHVTASRRRTFAEASRPELQRWSKPEPEPRPTGVPLGPLLRVRDVGQRQLGCQRVLRRDRQAVEGRAYDEGWLVSLLVDRLFVCLFGWFA